MQPAHGAGELTVAAPFNKSERHVTLRLEGSDVVVIDDDTLQIVARNAAAATQGVIVQGIEGGDHRDTLTVDLRGGLQLPGGVMFDAGVAGFDTLNISHDPAREVRYDFYEDNERGHRGRVVIDGTEIAYSGIEPLSNSGTVSNFIFTLPGGTTGASLEDDGTPGNGTVRLRSTDGTFETTTFAVPTNSLTVNGMFSDGITSLGSVSLNAAGVATLATSTLTVGSHNVTAAYAGNGTFAPATSPVQTQTINKVPSSIALSGPTSLTAGAWVTYTAVVSTAVIPATASPVDHAKALAIGAGSIAALGGTVTISDGAGGPTDTCVITLPAISCQIAPISTSITTITATFNPSDPTIASAAAAPTVAVAAASPVVPAPALDRGAPLMLLGGLIALTALRRRA